MSYRTQSPLRLALTAAALLAAAPAASAQMGMDGPTVLRAARMFDATTGRIVQGAVLVVENGRITAVNPAQVPESNHDMDLGDVTLLPGFIDAHTHLGGEIGPTAFTAPVTETVADATLHAVKNGATTVRAGFTTVRDFGGDATVALAEAVERGDVLGPHIVPSRNALAQAGLSGSRRSSSKRPSAPEVVRRRWSIRSRSGSR